jgi:hypothetical protein
MKSTTPVINKKKINALVLHPGSIDLLGELLAIDAVLQCSDSRARFKLSI